MECSLNRCLCTSALQLKFWRHDSTYYTEYFIFVLFKCCQGKSTKFKWLIRRQNNSYPAVPLVELKHFYSALGWEQIDLKMKKIEHLTVLIWDNKTLDSGWLCVRLTFPSLLHSMWATGMGDMNSASTSLFCIWQATFVCLLYTGHYTCSYSKLPTKWKKQQEHVPTLTL